MSAGIVWKTSPSDLAEALEGMYHDKVVAAVGVLMTLFAGKIEAYAKANAPWTDRTGNARQTLFTVVDLATDMVTLYLSHGMEYGKFLELCNSGKYAIIMPALQAAYGEISQALKDLFA